MKIQRTLLTTIGLLSSAVVWAADPQDLLFISGNETGRWTNTVDVAKGYPQVVTTDVATDEILDGALTYRINHSGYKGYDFTIKAQANDDVNSCNLNGNSHLLRLDGAGTGPRIYEISAEGMVENNILSCTVTVVDKGENLGHIPPQPQLILEHDHYLEVGYQACTNGKKTPVAVKTVKPFQVNDKHFLAVIVNGYSSTGCGADTKSPMGVHIYEWDENGKKFEHKQFINGNNYGAYYSNTRAIEIFKEDMDSNLNLAIATSQQDNVGVIDLWLWKGDDEGFVLDYPSSNLGKDIGNFSITDIKYSKSMRSLIVTNGGSNDIGYNHYAYSFKRNLEDGVFNTKPHLSFPTSGAQAVEIFNDSSEDILFFANKNSTMSYEVQSSAWVYDETKPEGYKYKENDQSSSNILSYGAVHAEYFMIESQQYIMMANTKNDTNSNVQSSVHSWDSANHKIGEHADKIDASGASHWMHMNLDGQDYFFAGFSATPSSSTYQIYGWCTGKETAGHWCETAQPQSNNVRYYTQQIPDGENGGTFTSSGWEKITIDEQVYLIRYDSTTNGNGAGVQMLKPRVDFG